MTETTPSQAPDSESDQSDQDSDEADPSASDAAASTIYRPFHDQLLRVVEGKLRTGAGPGAIVVPTSRLLTRSLPGIELAVRLAEELDCRLLIVCSGEAQPADFPAELAAKLSYDRLMVRDVGELREFTLPQFKTSHHRLCTFRERNDVALKRNRALAFALYRGWPSLLFLDDDVLADPAETTLDAESLRGAVAAMSDDLRLRAIGWTVQEFPDNSVAGHARRLVGDEQRVFISAGALLVRCDKQTPFFPHRMYNEDWFFLMACALTPSARYTERLAMAGAVGQVEYQPYRSGRATSEEPGDILAEGLMNLLEDDGPSLWLEAEEARHWAQTIASRATMLAGIKGRLQGVRQHHDAAAAIAAALEAHRKLSASDMVSYVQAWAEDLRIWRRHLTKIAGRAPRTATPGEVAVGTGAGEGNRTLTVSLGS